MCLERRNRSQPLSIDTRRQFGQQEEDKRFLKIMETGTGKNQQGNWEMPLPFRSPTASMPNNRPLTVIHLNGLLRTLNRKPKMKEDYFQFMGKVFERGHAVPVPQYKLLIPSDHPNRKELLKLTESEREQVEGVRGERRTCYLPHFGVYHPRKPDQICVVFDLSAEFQGVSLNKEILPGPDLMNSLVEVLIRFRQDNNAVMCDIEQIFHSFHVEPKHRNFLRFLWFKDNDSSKRIRVQDDSAPVRQRALSCCSHLWATKNSRRRRGEIRERNKRLRPQKLLCRRRADLTPHGKRSYYAHQKRPFMLATANLRLHKVVSNSVHVMEAFPAKDHAKNIKDLDLRCDVLPLQRSLGVQWDIEKDHFTFYVSLPEKPFTRRGVLSVMNSVCDPLGFVFQSSWKGKPILQQLVIMGKKVNGNDPLGWDDPLS